MKPLKWIISAVFVLIVTCILFILPANIKNTNISPEVTINSTSINNTGDQITINYTLPKDFFSDSEAGQFLYIGFDYPGKYRGAFENQYVTVNQKAGTYTISLPYTKGLVGSISIMTHYEAAWGRGVDEYICKGSYSILSD